MFFLSGRHMAVIFFYSIECRCPCGHREDRQGFGVYSVFYSNERRKHVWLLSKRPAGCFGIRILIFSSGKYCLGMKLITCAA